MEGDPNNKIGIGDLVGYHLLKEGTQQEPAASPAKILKMVKPDA